jgi:hypothetical protein
VKKDNGEIESLHIVRHQVDHLAYSCLAKCFSAQLQTLIKKNKQLKCKECSNLNEHSILITFL